MGCFEPLKEYLNSVNYWKIFFLNFVISTMDQSSTMVTYLFVVIIGDIVDWDPAYYFQLALLTFLAISMPINLFCMPWIFSIKPAILYPVMCLVKAILFGGFGLILYQEEVALEYKLAMGFVLFVALKILIMKTTLYIGRNVFPEMSKMYGIKMGAINSTNMAMKQGYLSFINILIGHLYVVWSPRLSSFYLLSSFAILQVLLALTTVIMFQGVSGAEQKAMNKGIVERTKRQFKILQDSEVKELALITVMRAIMMNQQQGPYVLLYLLSVGLTEVTVTYVFSTRKIMRLLAAVCNVLKYKWTWEHYMVSSTLLNGFIGMVSALAITGSWVIVKGIPFISGEPEPQALNSPQLWLYLYIAWNIATAIIVAVCDSFTLEYIQLYTPPADRGAINGICSLLGNLITFTHGVLNLLFPDGQLIYISTFLLGVVANGMIFYLSYRFKIRLDQKIAYSKLMTEEEEAVESEN